MELTLQVQVRREASLRLLTVEAPVLGPVYVEQMVEL
jgi:hypothetical protein